MGYTILIGNVELQYDSEGELDRSPSCYLAVSPIELDEAPDIYDSKKMNSRSPSYCQFREFTETVGAFDLFYNKEYGLISNRTGNCISIITKYHVDEINRITDLYKKYNPNCINQVAYTNVYDLELDTGEYYDWNFSKLLWYKFWINWAYQNCKYPAVYYM